MFDITSFLTLINSLAIIKVIILVMLFIYVIFSVIVTVQARAFHRIVYIGDSFGSMFIQLLAILHLLFSISLFLFALAIL